MYVGDTGDCLIFLASLNLCNAYVKNNKDKSRKDRPKTELSAYFIAPIKVKIR